MDIEDNTVKDAVCDMVDNVRTIIISSNKNIVDNLTIEKDTNTTLNNEVDVEPDVTETDNIILKTWNTVMEDLNTVSNTYTVQNPPNKKN